MSFGVNNQGTDNVLLDSMTDAMMVTGTFGSNDRIVEFTSSSGSGLLTANPSGQATVTGGTGNDPLTEITFGVTGTPFTRAVFNLNAATSGDAQFTVEGFNIEGGFFQDIFSVRANGQNFFTIDAILGQSMTSIGILGVNGATFQDLRQVRIGGEGIINPTPVPEPASMLLLGGGLAAIAARRRRQRNKQVA
ncbi:MAG: PEP-CTERM sorting domain-containing protein [Acidobacteriota bacterium]|nr:PEP-CTERM sorting domain-containing protein [Acidobacteriota bacterium]